MVIRFYYRFTKSGCAFFTKEHVYMGTLTHPSIYFAMVATHSPSQSGLIEHQSTKLGATYGSEDKPEAGVW